MTVDSQRRTSDLGAGSISLRQLAMLSGIAEGDLMDLIDYGVLRPIAADGGAELFSIRAIPALQRAQNLRVDLALDAHAFALAVMLSGQIADLEAELRVTKEDLRWRRADAGLSGRADAEVTHNVQ